MRFAKGSRMKKLHVFSFATIIAIVIAGCSLPQRSTGFANPSVDEVATQVAMTLESLESATAILPTPTETTIGIQPTNTPAVTKTNEPTITPTYSSPLLTFDNNVNCRKGPGTNFPIVVLIKEGQTVEVVGATDKYWVVKAPAGTETCWLPAEFATPVGSVWTVPTISAADSPTEVPPIAPVWIKWNYFCQYTAEGSALTMEMEWADKNNNEDGYRILRNGEAVASLGADNTQYTDTVIVEPGATYRYAVEVFRGSISTKSSVIDTSCQ